MIIGVIVFLSAAFKFNLLFWSLFVILFYLIYLVFEKKYKNLEKLIWTALIGVSFGVLIAGINPYITNTLDHKNPFYPLMGEGKIDIMLINTPNYLTNKTRTESILVSMFSLPNNSKEERSEFPLPSNFSEINYDSAGLCDTRIGGFGFLFSWILVASIILYCLSIGIKNKMKNYFNFTLLLLLCSIFLLPSGWWARYVPFFYVFPLVMLLYSEYIQNKIEFTFFRNLIYITILINLAISFSSAFVKMIDNKTKVDNAIEEISTAKKPSKLNFGENISFKIKLDKQKIKYIVTPIDSLDLHTLSLYVHFSSSQFKVDRIGNIDLLKKL